MESYEKCRLYIILYNYTNYLPACLPSYLLQIKVKKTKSCYLYFTSNVLFTGVFGSGAPSGCKLSAVCLHTRGPEEPVCAG